VTEQSSLQNFVPFCVPLAKTTQSTGAESQGSNNLPARKGDRTRLQIEAAARVIFARDGFLNSTIAKIMKEAQRSIGVFYRLCLS
jgi:hypothetical protein